MSEQQIDLGDLVRDRVTGMTGIVIARTIWMNGCLRFSVQSQSLDKDSKPLEAVGFDEIQLELLEVGKVACKNRNVPIPVEVKRATGGPRPEVRF